MIERQWTVELLATEGDKGVVRIESNIKSPKRNTGFPHRGERRDCL